MLDELADLTDEMSEELASNSSDGDAPTEFRLGIGEYDVVQSPKRLTCHGLGSCIGVFLYDPSSGVGAGVHALLPRSSDVPDRADKASNDRETRYTETAVRTIHRKMTAHPDVNDEMVTAKLTGGSEMLRFVTLTTDVGSRNITAARETLDEIGVEIVGEDVGGEHGRIVEFDPTTGGVIVRKANGEQKVI